MMRAKDYKKVAHVYYNYPVCEWSEHLKRIDPDGYQDGRYAQRAMNYLYRKKMNYCTEMCLLALCAILVNITAILLGLSTHILWTTVVFFLIRTLYNLSEIYRMDHYSALLWERELIFPKAGDRKVQIQMNPIL